MKIESYPVLDEWIGGLDPKAAIEILRVLKILKAEGNQYGGNVFITPVKAFQEANLDQNLYESILFNLHAHEVICAVDTKSIPTSENLNIYSGSADSISDNIRIINPLFRYVFNLLQLKLGETTNTPQRLTEKLKLKLQDLKLGLSAHHGNSKKFLDKIISNDGQIPAYILAQVIRPTIKNKRLNKKDYMNRKENYDAKIRNCLKTLNPLLEQVGCKLKTRDGCWFLITINN